MDKKITDNKFYIKHDNFNLWLEDKFSESGIYSVLNDFCNGEDGKVISNSFTLKNKKEEDEKEYDFSVKVTWGNMSTGEAVVSSQQAKRMIREAASNEKELGGEMEGYGIAKECKDIDKKLKDEKIECPANLKDQLQAYAAFCAGIVLLQLLSDEKEKLLSLKLIEWMGDKKRKNSIGKHTYVSKERFIKNIGKFYNVNGVMAQKILEILMENDVIKRNQAGDKYYINVQ